MTKIVFARALSTYALLSCLTVYVNSAIHSSHAVLILVPLGAEPARARPQVVCLQGIPGSRSERGGEKELGPRPSQRNDVPVSALSLDTRP